MPDEKCKGTKEVPIGRGVITDTLPCTRKPVKDGYCKVCCRKKNIPLNKVHNFFFVNVRDLFNPYHICEIEVEEFPNSFKSITPELTHLTFKKDKSELKKLFKTREDALVYVIKYSESKIYSLRHELIKETRRLDLLKAELDEEGSLMIREETEYGN